MLIINYIPQIILCGHLLFLEQKEHQQYCRRVNLDLAIWGDKINNNPGVAMGSRWVVLQLKKVICSSMLELGKGAKDIQKDIAYFELAKMDLRERKI